MDKDNGTLLINVSRMDVMDYESIVQSLITSTDTMWLQSMLLDINDKDIVSKIEQLIEPGFVKLWDYEKRLGRGVTKLKRVITLEEWAKAKEYVDDLIVQSEENDDIILSEYTTWNIENRNFITNFIIAKYCGAVGAIQRTNPFVGINSAFQEQKNDMYQIYTENLFNRTNIKSLSNLSVDNILELRKLSHYYRKEVQKCLEKHLLPNDIPLSYIQRDCEKLSNDFCARVNDIVEENYSTGGILEGMALDIASFLFSPLSYFALGQKIVDLFLNKNERGFIMYLTKLQKYSR